MALAETMLTLRRSHDFSRTFKEILKSSKNNSQIHFVQRILRRLRCYTDLEEIRRFVKGIYTVLTTERSSDLVEYHVEAIEKKINNFDYAEADLIALSADEDENILYDGQPAENEIEDEEDIVNKSRVVSFWECYWNQCFSDFQKCILNTIESKSSDILNPYYMPDFFSYLRTLLLEIVLWSKLLYGHLSRYAGINTIENMFDNRSLSTDEITNSHAELYFHLKKMDQNKINLPLCKYIKENNNFRIALQRQQLNSPRMLM